MNPEPIICDQLGICAECAAQLGTSRPCAVCRLPILDEEPSICLARPPFPHHPYYCAHLDCEDQLFRERDPHTRGPAHLTIRGQTP